MSRVCCVSLPHDVTGCLKFVIVVFPDDTHLLFFVLERTSALAKGDLNAFYSRQFFTLDFVVVKTQNCLARI